MSDAAFDLSGSNWPKLQDVLIDALERPPKVRAAFLLQACGPDASLRREAESLLDAHADSGDFLEQLNPGQIGSLLDIDDDAWVDRDVGSYRIIRPLGRGGMGVVYLAHDPRLERRVAVKVLPAWLAADRLARRQLVNEARAAAALDHPNIGVIHEIGETDDGHPFIAMAYYDGETLAARIRRERLLVGDAIRLIGQIARGLGAAHARGYVHCDVKPSNILVISPGPQSPEGSIVKIVDFGIARYLEEAAVEGRRHAGTAAYVAPERTRGEPAAIRTDLWSMGVVLYEMLTGRLPFRTSDDRTLVEAIRHDEPVPIENLRPDVPPMLDEIVRRCLRKDAAERYADAAAFLGDLHRLDESRPSGSRSERRSGARHEGRLAVLALRNLSPESGLDYFAVGITQELVSRLSRLRGFRVIGGATSLQYAESGKRIAAIGLELGVATVLAGSVRQDGDRLRINVELLDAATEEILWSDGYHATSGEAPDVQGQIAQRVAEALHLTFQSDRPGPARVGTTDQTAYEHYLRGRYYADRFDEPSVALARTQFQSAIDRDPAFAQAWAGLADTYRVFDYLSLLSPHEAAARGRAAAERALALDPDLAAAHTSLATVLCDYYWEWEAADRHFRRAVELDPAYATGHQLYAEFLRDFGRIGEALEHIRIARDVDPLSPFYQLVQGTILMMSGRVAESIQLYDQLADTHPGYQSVHFYRGLACLHQGQLDQALAMMDEYDAQCAMPDAIAIRGAVSAMLGREGDARRLLERLDELSVTRYVAPFHRGFIHLGLGDVERTLDLLEQSVAERNWFVRIVRGDALFDPLRAHPRFQQILKTVGFETGPAR